MLFNNPKNFLPSKVSADKLYSNEMLLNADQIHYAQARIKELKKLQKQGHLVNATKLSRKDMSPGGTYLNYSWIEASNGRSFILYSGKDLKLGKGGFGSVKIAQEVGTKQWFAVKITHETDQHEIQVMKDLGLIAGEAIVAQKALEYIPAGSLKVPETPKRDKQYLFMALQEGQALNKVLSQNTHRLRTLSQKINMALNATKSVKALHDKGYAHRDLKPENMMFDPATQSVNLVDFGLSAKIAATAPTGGTSIYCAPEDDKWVHASIERDNYALGLTLGEILLPQRDRALSNLAILDEHYKQQRAGQKKAGLEISPKIKDAVLYQAVIQGALQQELDKCPSFEKAYHAQHLSLYKAMTQSDPKKRLSTAEAIAQLEQMQALLNAEQALPQIISDTLDEIQSLMMSNAQSQDKQLLQEASLNIIALRNRLDLNCDEPQLFQRAREFYHIAQELKTLELSLPLSNKLKQALNTLISRVAQIFSIKLETQALFKSQLSKKLDKAVFADPKLQAAQKTSRALYERPLVPKKYEKTTGDNFTNLALPLSPPPLPERSKKPKMS